MRPEAKLAEWTARSSAAPSASPFPRLDTVDGAVRYTVRAYGEDPSKGPIGHTTFELRDTGDTDEERASPPPSPACSPSRWLGVKLAPDQPNGTEVALAAFMESLRSEQLERLKGVLTPARSLLS